MGIIPADILVPLASMLGLGFLGLVAALGQWWGKRSPTPSDRTVEVAGAIVDSESVRLLAAALEAHTLELTTQRVEAAKEAPAIKADAEKARQAAYRAMELGGKLIDEIEELRRVVGDLANQIARSK